MRIPVGDLQSFPPRLYWPRSLYFLVANYRKFEKGICEAQKQNNEEEHKRQHIPERLHKYSKEETHVVNHSDKEQQSQPYHHDTEGLEPDESLAVSESRVIHIHENYDDNQYIGDQIHDQIAQTFSSPPVIPSLTLPLKVFNKQLFDAQQND